MPTCWFLVPFLEVAMSSVPNPVTELVRQMIRHEDELVNERLTWLGQFEGFLFVAYGLAVKDLNDPVLTWVVCLAGLLIAASILTATLRSDAAVDQLREQWKQNRGSLEGNCWEPDVQGIGGEETLWRRWSWPSRSLPILFALAWLAVAITQAVHHPTPLVGH
jgi:hypothetical protein